MHILGCVRHRVNGEEVFNTRVVVGKFVYLLIYFFNIVHWKLILV